MPFIRISPLCLPALFILCAYFDKESAICTLISLAFHECGHVLFIKLYKERITKIDISPFGITLVRNRQELSLLREISVFLAGPLFSILLFIASLAAGRRALAFFSLFYGVINLLPLRIFDGGRALECLLNAKVPLRSGGIMNALDISLLLVIWLISVYIMLTGMVFVPAFFIVLYLFLKLTGV